MDGRTYNPDDCITVAQMRAAGAPIPAELPDGAWVPKDAFRIAVQQRSEYLVDDRGQPLADQSNKTSRAKEGVPLQSAANLVMRFVVPFRWDVRMAEGDRPTEPPPEGGQ